MSKPYSENTLIEQPAIELLAELGWQTINAFHETFGADGTLGREHAGEVVLTRHLVAALTKLNPCGTAEAVNAAVDELTRDRSVMSLGAANRDVYSLLKNGVKVEIRTREGDLMPERIRVIDWDNPANNHFLLVSQFWATGEVYKRRADLVGFVNGLPLVLWELKAVHQRLEQAFKNNVTDYKDTVPQLIWYNGLHHRLQRPPEPVGQRDGGVGTLLRVEENCQRKRAGCGVVGDNFERHLRPDPAARHG